MSTKTAVRIEGGRSSRRPPLLALLHQGWARCCSTLTILRVLMISRSFASEVLPIACRLRLAYSFQRGALDSARLRSGHCRCASQPRGFKRARAWALAAHALFSL
eukprot:1749769-Alexandrium_andersonii.AAC.1